MLNFSDQSTVDLWVYNYLLERGLTHASFVFKAESNLQTGQNQRPRSGELLQLIEKGLLYAQLEDAIEEEASQGLLSVNGVEQTAEEGLRHYIDRRIAESLLEVGAVKELAIGRLESRVSIEAANPSAYKVLIFKAQALVWDKTENRLRFMNLLNEEQPFSEPLAIENQDLLASFKILFHDRLVFYNENALAVLDQNDNFTLKALYRLDEGVAKIKTVERTASFYIVTLGVPLHKVIFDLDGRPILRLGHNARVLELGDSFVIGNLDQGTIFRLWLTDATRSLEYKGPTDLVLVDCAANDSGFLLAGYFTSRETQKGYIFLWTVDSEEQMYSLELKGNFRQIRFDHTSNIILVGLQNLKVFDVRKAEFVYSENFDSTIRQVVAIRNDKLLVELNGNRMRKVDLAFPNSVEIDKSGSNGFMYACPAIGKVLEFENLENYKFVDV